jgi:hypothetical protein
MYPSPPMHTEIARLIHADRLREIERTALAAAAAGDAEGAEEVNGVLSRLGGLVPSVRLSQHVKPRRPAGGAV